jgi:tripartite-type tricarboxylate transporter receptor subunit TctC
MRRLLICFAALAAATSPAWTAEPVSFKGKTITMIIGFPAGGGTDQSGRLIAAMLAKHLPGEPALVTQNMPGAEGLMALNYFVQKTKPDGTSMTMGSQSESEPTHYRIAQSRYDPTKFVYIGGVGRGGSALVIKKDAEPRLHDKSLPPVIMGTTSGAPRRNMQMAGWGREWLNWNLRWVAGYRGTNDLFVAMERGEIEMTATANPAPIERLLGSGRFKLLAQAGAFRDGQPVARSDFGDAPLIPVLLTGKITDPVAEKASSTGSLSIPAPTNGWPCRQELRTISPRPIAKPMWRCQKTRNSSSAARRCQTISRRSAGLTSIPG